jgi:type VI secretion system protein ImpL
MFAFLKRTAIVLLGLLLTVVFIWYAGPYFAFGQYRPLETEAARLIAIGVILGCWLVARLLKRLRAARASDRLLAAVVAQPQPEQARTPAEVVKLRERFEEAVSALKQQRRSGHSVYDLPWYVIIGAPGSGKTTALLNSGLKFPLEQRVGKGALRGVGGTRNCDWWFTDEAVFLDTAGRYTTQDSDAASDSVGWSEFLALLRKHRARRPLNGVIVTVNAQDLHLQDAVAREAHVEAARQRLEELTRELRIRLPVYLLVTKCDLVDGFAEYFDDLTGEGRAQVWGVTFPYEQTLANEGPQGFPAEFDALMTRLNERVFDRVAEVRDTRRRTKVFAFPQQMATLREALTQWVTDVFAYGSFDGQILLRGVYFTSGTQEGTPIDRLLGSIGRTFGAADAVMRPGGPGKAYFVETLLKDVMIGESGLAGVNRGLELRNASAQLGAYAATGLIAAAGVAALSVSYNRNRAYLGEAGGQIAALAATAEVTPQSPLPAIAARLDAIRAVVDSSERYRETTWLPLRWGLYQGSSIGNSARDAYLRELDSTLLPRLAAQITTRMIQYGADPEKLYLYLKGYLMLGEPRHLEKEHLETLANVEWRTAAGGASSAAPALLQHLKALLDNGTLRPLPLDDTLVVRARSSTRPAMATVLYDGLRRDYNDEPGQGLRLDQLAGMGVERVFERRSRKPLSTPIPRLYTREVFKQITRQGRAELLQRLAKDGWVWGDSTTASLSNAGALVSTVTNIYEADYIRVWDEVLDDLQLASFSTIAEVNDALRVVTSSTSPLRGLLRVVADNTTLVESAPAPAPAATGVIAETRKKVTDTLTGVLKPMQAAAGMPSGEPGRLVTARFQWVRQLAAGEAGKTQLDAIIQTLLAIQQQLDTLGPDVAGGSPRQMLANPSFRALMQTLRQQTAESPAVLRTLVTQMAEASGDAVVRGASDQLDALYNDQIVPTCTRLIANRYPFADSQTDVQLADFGTVFGHGGLFDKFFTEQLDTHVDTSTSTWAWRPGSVIPSRPLLPQFQDARRVRDMFFAPGSKTPELKFFVTFSDLDPGAQRFVLQIDGQNFDDKHLKQSASWPGPVPGYAASTFESRYFDPSKTYGGPWAWFRQIDETRVGAPDPQQRILLNIQNRHHRVRVTIEPTRASDNPFATGTWRRFSCEA